MHDVTNIFSLDPDYVRTWEHLKSSPHPSELHTFVVAAAQKTVTNALESTWAVFFLKLKFLSSIFPRPSSVLPGPLSPALDGVQELIHRLLWNPRSDRRKPLHLDALFLGWTWPENILLGPHLPLAKSNPRASECRHQKLCLLSSSRFGGSV